MKNRSSYILIFLALILSSLFFVLKLRSYLHGGNGFSVEERFFPSEDVQKEVRDMTKAEVKSKEYYVNLFGTKNLFRVLAKEKSSFSVEEAMVDSEMELARFELLGIVSSGGAAKALIKDTRSGKTFYGAVGEKLATFAIKEIMSNKIILEREGEIFELKL